MTFIIAEIGVNHNGSVALAKDLVIEAASAGADAVKFQAFTPERLDPPGPRREMLDRLALRFDEFVELAQYATEVGVEFMVTPFDADWLNKTLPLVKRIKIASGCLWDRYLLVAARNAELPVILSTGMTDEEELLHAMHVLKGVDITLLHCVSQYPTRPENLNLRRMTRIASLYRNFGVEVGLSDHSQLMWAPALAVSLGATVIEKHLTLDRGMTGPDHAASLEPGEFAEMVSAVLRVDDVLGSGELWPAHPAVAGAAKVERMAWAVEYTAAQWDMAYDFTEPHDFRRPQRALQAYGAAETASGSSDRGILVDWLG